MKFARTEFRLYLKIGMTINLETSTDHETYCSVKAVFLKYKNNIISTQVIGII